MVDKNPDALALAKQIGADETVVADGSHIDAVKDLTNGAGAKVVFDFVAEQGAENDAWQMTAPDGSSTSSATAARSRPRRWTSSAARRTSSATSSAPTPTSPS